MTEENVLEGVIVKGVGGLYYAREESGQVYVIRAKGKFRKQRVTPMVGDHIRFTPAYKDEHGWMEEILPRKSELCRPAVANISRVLLVIAPEPAPDFLLVDALLVMASMQNIQPVLVVNKCDLDQNLFPKVQEEYAALKIPMVEVSAKTGQGIETLRPLMKEGVCCFAGQSGTGKSSLLNAATGLELKSGEISQKIGRGKHTTRHVELMFKDGYQVLDTPGFTLLELDNMDPIRLQDYYPDFAPYLGKCRFKPCYHLSEPGCNLLEAAREGAFSQKRLERYHLLLERMKEGWKNRYD